MNLKSILSRGEHTTTTCTAARNTNTNMNTDTNTTINTNTNTKTQTINTNTNTTFLQRPGCHPVNRGICFYFLLEILVSLKGNFLFQNVLERCVVGLSYKLVSCVWESAAQLLRGTSPRLHSHRKINSILTHTTSFEVDSGHLALLRVLRC